jgi:hypothetical protein
MDFDPATLPDDIDALKDIVRSALAALDAAKADAAAAKAERSDIAAYIAHLKLQIEKLKRTIYGPRAERTARLLDQNCAQSRPPRRAALSLPAASRASVRHVSPFPIICRANGSFCRDPLPAPAAVARAWPSWARA